jgi:ribose/xylose/arabinose/galactoside ABC-type transport system permease subunit
VEPDVADQTVTERDRLAVHAAWEAVLLIALGVAAALVWSRSTGALSGDQLRDQLVIGASSVLLAAAFGVSLRAAAPNLAAGGIAVAAAVLTGYVFQHTTLPLGAAIGIAAGAAAAVGLLLGLITVGLRAPAWAVSIGAATLLAAAVVDLAKGQPIPLAAEPDLRKWAWAVFGGAALVAIAGGALGATPRVRTFVGQYRIDRDPAIGRGGPAGAAVIGALVVSALLAAGAGVIAALHVHTASPAGGPASLPAVAAFAAALLGGTSAHGRRGGVFGTVLAASALQLLLLWLSLGDIAQWIQITVLGGAVVLGLAVTRIIEGLGTPQTDYYDTTVPIPEDDAYPTRYIDLM